MTAAPALVAKRGYGRQHEYSHHKEEVQREYSYKNKISKKSRLTFTRHHLRIRHPVCQGSKRTSKLPKSFGQLRFGQLTVASVTAEKYLTTNTSVYQIQQEGEAAKTQTRTIGGVRITFTLSRFNGFKNPSLPPEANPS